MNYVAADRRKDLRRAYLRLGTGEIAAAVVFAIVAHVSVRPRLPEPGDEILLWVAMLPLEVMLLQAGAYWLMARDWVLRTPMPAGAALAFRALRMLTGTLLVLCLLVLLVRMPDAPVWAALAFGLWAGGVIEFVNYYVVRLAYPVGGWVAGIRARRTPRLARDLRDARRRRHD